MRAVSHEKVKEVFQRALEVPKGERTSFVTHACRGNTDLAAEILSLLQFTDESHEFDVAENHSSLFTNKSNRRTTFLLPRDRFLRTIGLTSGFVLFALACFFSLRFLSHEAERVQRDNLAAIASVQSQAISDWLDDRLGDAEKWVQRDEVKRTIFKIVKEAQFSAVAAISNSSSASHQKLEALFSDYPRRTWLVAYSVQDRTNLIIAASDTNLIGKRMTPQGAAHMALVLSGESRVRSLQNKSYWVANQQVSAPDSVHEVWIDIPSYDELGEIGAVFSVAVPVTQIIGMLYSSDSVKSVEIFAVGRGGEKFLSPDLDNDSLFLFDPFNQREMPWLEYKNNYKNAYTNSRGQNVMGVWFWLDSLEMGIVAEAKRSDALSPIFYLELVFGFLFLLLLLILLTILYLWWSPFLSSLRKKGMGFLGNYSLVEKIGEGGTGQIYLAQHCYLKRPAAVKVLKPSCFGPGVIDRFEQEVQLASSLSHPNTICIFDYGRTDDGIFYYSMEYLRGINLAQLIKIEPLLPIDRVLHILQQVCFSLKEAHLEGFIHRDIKPLNIMLCYLGREYDVVKVLDFGLVKKLENQNFNSTRTRLLTGTPMYMAPERIQNPDRVGVSADIYSVGALAYNLITGRQVFDSGKNDMSLLYDVINLKPKPPSSIRRDISIPAEFEKTIMACLEKDPNKRPSSISELLGKFAEIPWKWSSEQSRAWWENNPRARKYLAVSFKQGVDNVCKKNTESQGLVAIG